MLVLIGDIGGTKTLLNLIEISPNFEEVTVVQKGLYSSQNYSNFSLIVQDFLDNSIVDEICIAIAGPVINNTCRLTNLNWYLQGEELAKEFNCKRVSILNDFAAISYGVLTLKESDLFTLQIGEKQDNSPIGVMGAGTGLGQSFLVKFEDKYQVFSTEGGHTDFAPTNELEWQLLNYLKQQLKLDRISVERVVSGQGIACIYQFLRDTKFASESPEIAEKIRQWETGDNNIDAGAIIGESALAKNDILTTKTMAMFLDAYAGEIGNFALKILPYSGIYIAGGIAAKILPLIEDSDFVETFLSKGRMKPLLEKMPLNIVKNSEVALQGLLYCLTK